MKNVVRSRLLESSLLLDPPAARQNLFLYIFGLMFLFVIIIFR